MTAQILAQLSFLHDNGFMKQLELNKVTSLYEKFGLPHYDREVHKREKGIEKVKDDLEKQKDYARKLMKEEQIYQINLD